MNPREVVAALRVVWQGTASPEDLASLARYGNDSIVGLAVQLDVLDAWLADGETLGGWKVGLSSRGARDSMGPGVRPFGYVLSRRVLPNGSTGQADLGFDAPSSNF